MPSLDASDRPAVNPNVAALLTWLVPGAGHFLLGQMRLALAAFILIEGLYVAGLALTGGAFLELLAPEIRGRFAGALTPEVGNFGAFLLHVRDIDFSDLTPPPFDGALFIGLALTSTSGILNLILASRAHFDARARSGAVIEGAAVHPARAVLLGWLIPGAGHLAQGRVARGVFCFVLITGMFTIGCVLAEGTNLDRTRHFYYWAGQTLLGPTAFVAEYLSGHPLMELRPRYSDAGVMLASVAGVLNVLLLLDVYGFSDAKLFGRPLATEQKTTGGAGQEAA
jgi:TM2 domain-containing membrane protein YozV